LHIQADAASIVQPRMSLAPAPICGYRAEWAPRQRHLKGRSPDCRQVPRHFIQSSSPRRPRRPVEAPLRHQGIVPLSTRSSRTCLSLACRIGPKEPSCLNGHELVGLRSIGGRAASTPTHRLPHVSRRSLSEDEETAIYPEIGILAWREYARLFPTTAANLDEMGAE